MLKYSLLLVYFFFFLNITANAGGFKLGLQGQKQLGMGHTGVGFAQDAATIYFNPAGMSFVGSQFNGGFFALMPNTSFIDQQTNSITHAVSQVFTPFSAYASLKLSKRVNFGIGAYTPFGSGVLYPHDWAGRFILHNISLQTVFLQPTLSLRITDYFSVGGGFVYGMGSMQLEKDLPIQSSSHNEISQAVLYGKGKGAGYNIGAYVKGERLNFGLTYHSKVIMKVTDGAAKFINIPVSLAANFPSGNTFNAELPLPSELSAGTSFKVSKRTTAAVDLNYTFWKTFDSLGFDYKINTASLSDAKSPRMYENAFSVKAGLQHKATKNTTLRIGAWYDQTPVQDGYVSPELPDNSKFAVTCGATFRIYERFHFDLSLVYENIAKRTQTNRETGLSGTFHTKAIAPGVGMTYLFQKRTYKRKRY